MRRIDTFEPGEKTGVHASDLFGIRKLDLRRDRARGSLSHYIVRRSLPMGIVAGRMSA
jgi:hypothetical protein